MMNFQFSGSIPNVHWHSRNNTMSSQSVTEFTILNGRVTVTRASGDDTRNDVNVTIVANGRRNENPRRRANCLCHREIRWRNRRRQGLPSLLRSVHDLKDNVSDATDDLSVSRRKFQDLKDEIRKIKTELNDRKSKLENATFELGRAVGDLQTSQLYNLNNEESGILGYDLNLAECDIEQARRRIREAESDLNSVRTTFSQRRESNVQNEDNQSTRRGGHRSSLRYFETIASRVGSTRPYNRFSPQIMRNKCSVCLENDVNSVLYKCGHMCMCYACAVKLQYVEENVKCPVCRSEVTDIIKTYWS